MLTKEKERELLIETIESLGDSAMDIFMISETMDCYTLPNPHDSCWDCTQYYPDWFRKAYTLRDQMRALEEELKKQL